MIVHLIDGTFELFRYFLSPAAAFDRSAPEELRAVRGVVGSVLGMLEGGATHLGVATDHVIESFRNALWSDYKTGEGIDPLLYAQFQPLEEALGALGVVVWPMVEFEADDALAAAAAMAAADARVDQVVVCSPDKDLAQCVSGDRIVQLDRRTRELRNEPAVQQKFGVLPPRFPTGSPSWVTVRTAIPVCPAGARRPPRRCWPAIITSSTFRTWRRTGRCPCAGRCGWPRRSRSSASVRCCSGSSRAADGCAPRRGRGRAALERPTRRLRDLVGATRRAAASRTRRGLAAARAAGRG